MRGRMISKPSSFAPPFFMPVLRRPVTRRRVLLSGRLCLSVLALSVKWHDQKRYSYLPFPKLWVTIPKDVLLPPTG